MVPRKSSEVLVNQAVELILQGGSYLDGFRVNLGDNVGDKDVGNNIDNVDKKDVNIVEEIYGLNRLDGIDSNKENKDDSNRRRNVRILDIGTGSGCLLLSTLEKIDRIKKTSDFTPNSLSLYGVGVDISEGALEVASKNASFLGLKNQACFSILDFANLSDLVAIKSDNDVSENIDVHDVTINSIANPNPSLDHYPNPDPNPSPGPNPSPNPNIDITPSRPEGPFDIIICNPPYSSKREVNRLSIGKVRVRMFRVRMFRVRIVRVKIVRVRNA
jgi:SAM-dependent methyltransferase